MKVVSDKPLRVVTMGGTAVVFQPGVTREVGEAIGFAAIQMGARQVESPVREAATSQTPVETSEPKNSKSLVEVLNDLIDKADPEDFKADGTPKAAAVNKAAGRTVRTDEREQAWEQALNS